MDAAPSTTFRCPEMPSPFDTLSVAEKPARGAVVGQRGSPDNACGAFLDWSAASVSIDECELRANIHGPSRIEPG